MMQNFRLEDLSHVQSRRNLLKYLVRVEMASDWFTRIYRSILAEQISSKSRLGCGLLEPAKMKKMKKITIERKSTSTRIYPFPF